MAKKKPVAKPKGKPRKAASSPEEAAKGGLTIERVPLDALYPDPANARLHGDRNLDAIRGSLAQFGQARPLVVQASSMRIIAGNGTYAAMRLLGWTHCDIVRLPFSDVQATAYGIADNRTGELAEWDLDVLDRLVGDLQGDDTISLDSIGLGEGDLDELLGDVELGEPEMVDDEAVPEAPAKPRTRLGDVYVLGEHRLMCGDATSQADVDGLMQGARAPLVWTDPPYNIASEATGFAASSDSKQIGKLMASDWDKSFRFESAQGPLLSAVADDATVYVCTSHHLAPSIWAWMAEWSDYHSYCVWSKSNPMPSLSKRHWTWSTELVCYATRGKHTFNFPAEGNALSAWAFSKVAKCDVHPTMKPTPLVTHSVTHSSSPGDLVVDLFGGAGSTLMACEASGRVCRMMERDPGYCDVIVTRWEKHTSDKATLAKRGGC